MHREFSISLFQRTMDKIDEKQRVATLLLQLFPYKISENYRPGSDQVVFILQLSTWNSVHGSIRRIRNGASQL